MKKPVSKWNRAEWAVRIDDPEGGGLLDVAISEGICAACTKSDEETFEEWGQRVAGCCGMIAQHLDPGPFSEELSEFKELQELLSLQEKVDHPLPIVALEWATAERDGRELLNARPDQRQRMLERGEFHSWGLVNWLLGIGWAKRFDRPGEYLEACELAACIVPRLDREHYLAVLCSDLEARIRGHVGNAHRILGDLRRAREEFRRAEQALLGGTGSGEIRAEYLRLKVSLLLKERWFIEAEAALSECSRLTAEFESKEKQAQLDLKRSHCCYEMDELGKAERFARRALERLEGANEPVLRSMAFIALANCAAGNGDAEAAREFLGQTAGVGVLGTRRVWSQAIVDRLSGNPNAALVAFETLAESFAGEGNAYDAVLANLEIAQSALEAKKAERAVLAADQALRIAARYRLHIEATAALAVLVESLRTAKAGTEAIVRVRRKLKQLPQ